MAQEVFRFVSLKEIKDVSEDIVNKHTLISSSGSGPVSNLVGAFNREKAFVGQKVYQAKILKILSDFAGSAKNIKDVTAIDNEFSAYNALIASGDFKELFRKQQELASLKNKLRAHVNNLTDTIVYTAFGLAPAPKGLMKTFRNLALLEKVVSGDVDKESEAIAELNKEIIVGEETLPVFDLLKYKAETKTPVPVKSSGQKAGDDKMKKIGELEAALSEMAKPTSRDFKTASNKEVVLKPEVLNAFSLKTKAIYVAASQKLGTSDFFKIHSYIQTQYQELSSPVPVDEYRRVVILNSKEYALPKNPAHRTLPAGTGQHGKYVKVYGVADFEVLKQVWHKFDVGEIAHIENVMNGERKTRTHTRTEETETITESFSEMTETSERELETTNRFELQSEIDKIHKEKYYVDGQVSFSYSTPFMDLKSTVKAGYENTTNTESKLKTNYAKEVVESAVNRINKTVRESSKVTTIRKVIETNEHHLEGTRADGSHTVGVYRWVDKWYKGWVENIGKRMVLEFNIPEPAAFYIYSKSQKPEGGIDIPLEPQVEGPARTAVETANAQATREKLSPSHINDYNYLKFAQIYKVKGVEAPPERYRTYSLEISDETGPGQAAIKAINKILPALSGYNPSLLWGDFTGNFTQTSIGASSFKPFTDNKAAAFGNRLEFRRMFVSVNGQDIAVDANALALGSENTANPRKNADEFASQEKYDFFVTFRDMLSDITSDDSRFYYGLPSPVYHQGALDNVALSIQAKGMALLNGTIKIMYARSKQLYFDWQVKTYDKIMAAYAELKAAADEKSAQQRIRQGVMISGQNPAVNKEVVDTELKKHCIDFMCQDRFRGGNDSIELFDAEAANDAYPVSENATGYPEYNYEKAFKQGKVIEFFEQAFEWNYLMYQLYPYFWGNKDRWMDNIRNGADTDPLFGKFLSAGSCRVVVPARPGFEKAVANFLQRGTLWDNSEPEVIAGVSYHDANTLLSIIQQVTEEVTKESTECWPKDVPLLDIKIPTSLVYLGNDNLPLIKQCD